MAIGKHQCKNAWDLDYKGWIAVCLDEALTALEESFFDLTDEQMRAFAIPGRNNIAWIVMHAMQNLDEYTNLEAQAKTFEHEPRWSLWNCTPEQRPKRGDSFPSKEQMMKWLGSLRQRAEATLQRVDEEFLRSKTPPEWRWPGNRADFYKRTIFHTMAHVRQIWLLRGALGLTDGKSWPQQHYA
jgi:hypothetical protein